MSLGTENSTPMTMPVAPIGAMGNNGGLGGWGGDALIALIMMFLFPMIYGGMGWGGMGMMGGMGMWPWMFGGFGGNNGGCGCGNPATQADVQRAVDQQTLISKIDQQTYGISQATYDINNTLQNGFAGAELSRCNQQAALMQMLYQMSSNQQSCCCETQRAIERANYDAAIRGNETNRLVDSGFCTTNYNAATNTNAIIQNAHNDTDRVLAKLDAMEMSRKDELIADLRTKLAACGDQTTAQYIINQLTGIISPRAVPAYPAPSPCGLGNWAPQVLANSQCGNGWGCGCNSGCGC